MQKVSTWEASKKLPSRVKKLREEYFNYEKRGYFRNEAIPYTTGLLWDSVYTPHERTIVPEFVPHLSAVQDSLLAMAKKVNLPRDFWKQPLIARHAILFREVLKVHPVFILDGELIVGAHFATALSNCLNEEEAREWRRKENEFLEKVKYLIDRGVLNCGATQGHIIPNHKKILEKGFRGVEKEARALLTKSKSQQKKDLLRAIIICCEGVKIFSQRYAYKARELARGAESNRKKELLNIASSCERVPYYPVKTFYEALQSVWFQHMLVMLAESYPGPGTSYGRFDQYMYPYYEKDLQEGRLTREKAKELLQCFWIKHNYAYDAFGTCGGKQGITSGDGQLITLGGQGLKGEDCTNDLTYLILEVAEEMNLLEPKLNVRLHANTPEEFLNRLCEIIKNTQGSPFVLNFDSMAITALENEGMAHGDAVDYGVVGCLENTAQGKDRSGTVDVNINLAKGVELALNQGKDMRTGEQIGEMTPDPTEFRSFEEFEQAYFEQVKQIIKLAVDTYAIADTLRAIYEPVPYLSSLIEGCMEKGRDVNAGGAVYNFITVEGVGFATAADSLTAVKKMVYEKGRISMEELLEAIRSNFQNEERLRQMLMNQAPKYGNDDDYADEVAREISRFWAQEVAKYVSPITGRRFRAGYLSWNYFISFAPFTAATPDGRKRGEYLSNAVCPVQGRDKLGPTAAFKSVTNLGFEVVPNGASYTPSFSPASLRDEEHLMKFSALLRAFEELGGTAMQINVIDADTLKDAQKHPENYQNLLVRVTGYNAYFVTIGRALQDEIIARTVHAV